MSDSEGLTRKFGPITVTASPATGLASLSFLTEGGERVAVLSVDELTKIESTLIERIAAHLEFGEPIDLAGAFTEAMGRNPFEA
ncbi:hypothetical protein BDK92_7153 [Micromonospora pisi]|uniref:Uncharacterized protein n=1 Tax=Micromonospora pisi TaxID=589240 RepID=A0A495JUJ3_9ACTN|nr:hypothetical protein [Micromonospora pisi]RKR92676.1 hypothetical protein BDK92_7153 [Micromonospora pisi]